jgi:ribosomal protein L15
LKEGRKGEGRGVEERGGAGRRGEERLKKLFLCLIHFYTFKTLPGT